MGILFFIFNLLISYTTGGNLSQVSRQDAKTTKVVNVGKYNC